MSLPYYSVKSPLLHPCSFYVINSTLQNTDTVVYDDRKNNSRDLTEVGTDSYIRSQRRAFARAKQLAFFNPQLTQFITLTYKSNDQTPIQVYEDIKLLLKNHKNNNPDKPLQYMYVLERQKRGSIHVHMITNNALQYYINKNNHLSIKYWKKGFSSLLTIDDVDMNFKPYLYLFKYMAKSQRVGGSFIHISRNFAQINTFDYNQFIDKINMEDLIHSEQYAFTVNTINHRIIKNYYRKKEVTTS